jgi:hypothetical protein
MRRRAMSCGNGPLIGLLKPSGRRRRSGKLRNAPPCNHEKRRTQPCSRGKLHGLPLSRAENRNALKQKGLNAGRIAAIGNRTNNSGQRSWQVKEQNLGLLAVAQSQKGFFGDFCAIARRQSLAV